MPGCHFGQWFYPRIYVDRRRFEGQYLEWLFIECLHHGSYVFGYFVRALFD